MPAPTIRAQYASKAAVSKMVKKQDYDADQTEIQQQLKSKAAKADVEDNHDDIHALEVALCSGAKGEFKDCGHGVCVSGRTQCDCHCVILWVISCRSISLGSYI